ncbi:MAG TPA: hypothetical protein VJ694_02530 [Patescibacteria group bacterium]|nr:hypothetical protein [Patescibacteria group bacterium]
MEGNGKTGTGLIVVFGTTDIMSEDPAYDGQEPIYVNACPQHGYKLWSSGKLERALGEGHDVYVVTVVPLFRPEDAWWRELVPAERIYRPVTDARGEPSQAYDHFINGPWKRFLADIGRPWPKGVEDAIAWRSSLDGSDGLLYGGRLAGFAGSA